MESDTAGLVSKGGDAGRIKARFAFLAKYTDERFPAGHLVTYAANCMQPSIRPLL